jgi:hypothetical protein
MDVGAWLRGLGLGQYETTFRESEIDAEVLPDLTEGDLIQLGMPLGHRKPSDHRDVLRPRRFHESCCKT